MPTKLDLIKEAKEVLEDVLNAPDDGTTETYDLYEAMKEAVKILRKAQKAS